MKLEINGRSHDVDVDPETPLLWVIREDLGLSGTKYGCGSGLCGACTLHVDGEAVRACTLPVGRVAGARITTIEGLGQAGLHAVQRAWIAEQVPQCGYCQPGMIMAAVALLARSASPSEAEIDASITNLCRCGTYSQIRRAIQRAAAELTQPARTPG